MASVLAMVGCTQIPVRSLWALRKFDMAQIDGAQLRALVYVPEGAGTLRDTLKVPLKIERGGTSNEIIKEMQEMRRENPPEMMDVHARSYTDAQIKLIADYFAKLAR